jgi:hypothetical protein
MQNEHVILLPPIPVPWAREADRSKAAALGKASLSIRTKLQIAAGGPVRP